MKISNTEYTLYLMAVSRLGQLEALEFLLHSETVTISIACWSDGKKHSEYDDESLCTEMSIARVLSN